MRLLQFIPVRLTIVLVLGIILGRLTSPTPEFPLFAAGLCLFLLALKLLKILQIPAIVHGFLVLMAISFLGMLSYTVVLPENQRNHILNSGLEGTHLYYINVREVWKPTAYSRRYVVSLRQADNQGMQGNLLLNVEDQDEEAFEVDDMLLVKGELAEIRENQNPYQFDYRRYLHNLGITRQLTAKSSHIITGLPTEKSMAGKAAEIRKTVMRRLREAGMENEAIAMVNALVLGQRTDISRETFDAFRDAGALHILAVSGLHIGILLVFLNLLLKPLDWIRGGRVARLCLLLVMLWGYALLAGFTPSIVRAVSMFSFVAYALYLNRPANSFNIMSLSVCFILLAINPLLLFQVGFQMSYAAVFAILCFLPLLQGKRVIHNRLGRKAWQLLSVSLAAQIGVLPVSLYYFHQFPGLFFISNLLIIPLLGVLLGTGFLVATMAYAAVLPHILARTFETLLQCMTWVVGQISEQEAFVFRDIPFGLAELLLLYLVILFFARILSRFSSRRLVLVSVAVILFQCHICWRAYMVSREEQVWITHRPGHTLVLHQAGNQLETFSSADRFKDESLVRGFLLGLRCSRVEDKPLLDAYRWNTSSLVVIDGKTPWIPLKGRKRLLLLTGSAKIHMGRLLDSLKPTMVIADGSNYPSYTPRWKRSCDERHIPFHFTGTDGAFSMNISGD